MNELPSGSAIPLSATDDPRTRGKDAMVGYAGFVSGVPGLACDRVHDDFV